MGFKSKAKYQKQEPEIENTVLENYNKTLKFKKNMYIMRLSRNERAIELTDTNDLTRERIYNLNKNF